LTTYFVLLQKKTQPSTQFGTNVVSVTGSSEQGELSAGLDKNQPIPPQGKPWGFLGKFW